MFSEAECEAKAEMFMDRAVKSQSDEEVQVNALLGNGFATLALLKQNERHIETFGNRPEVW